MAEPEPVGNPRAVQTDVGLLCTHRYRSKNCTKNAQGKQIMPTGYSGYCISVIAA